MENSITGRSENSVKLLLMMQNCTYNAYNANGDVCLKAAS